MQSELGPDELSELAECLDDACQVAMSFGLRIGKAEYDCCPLGAAMGPSINRQPSPGTAASFLGIPYRVAALFVSGFDGHVVPDSDAYNLGRSFRERYVGADK